MFEVITIGSQDKGVAEAVPSEVLLTDGQISSDTILPNGMRGATARCCTTQSCDLKVEQDCVKVHKHASDIADETRWIAEPTGLN